MTTDIPLGPGREFDVIRDFLRRWGATAAGIGDDAAVLAVPPGELLVASTDSSIEDVHFRRDWLAPAEIGWRSAMAALSDLAAMAATPLGVLIALSVPEGWLPDVGPLADGLGDAVAAAGTHILGGDLTRARELGIAVTVLGSAAEPLRRSSAQPGDIVYVSGTFGGPLAAIAALRRGDRPLAQHQERFARPVARLREARWLAEAGARGAVDISDGLLADLAHMAAASGVTIVVELDALPLVADILPEDAARSGEEYELAVVAPTPLDRAAFERTFQVPLTPIGRVRAGTPTVEATLAGVRVASTGGWDHFS